MKILAVYPYIHLSSAALLIDGEIVAASPEERFDRLKMSTNFPNKSAEWCLKSQGLKWEDLDMIVVPWNPMRNVNHASRRWVSEMNWRGQLLSHVPIQNFIASIIAACICRLSKFNWLTSSCLI